MAEGRLFIDIEPKPNKSADSDHSHLAEKPLWTHSNNSFKFNFFPGSSSAPSEEVSLADGSVSPVKTSTRLTPFEGQGSGFAFNFRIPAVTPQAMETAAVQSPGKEQTLPDTHKQCPPADTGVSSKAKKKKKSAKMKAPQSKEAPQMESSNESQANEDAGLTAEQRLGRELDWCMEKLELGLKTQKATPKQKEDASHALKTLRSSKAPLAKKRQIMRAMTGDYRKKMQEEKDKQFTLIQKAVASAQVKAVSGTLKMSVFHRRAADDTQEESGQQMAQNGSQDQNQKQTSQFVFTPSKDEFRFNFI